MALSDLLNKPIATLTGRSTDKIEAIIKRLESELVGATAESDRLKMEYETILADRAMAEQSLDDPSVTKAMNAASSAKDRESALSAALATARARLTSARNSESREALAALWSSAVSIAEKRTSLAKKLEASTTQFARDYAALLESNRALFESLPTKSDPEAAMLNLDLIEIATRKELLRQGVTFAISWPWGVHDLPNYMPQFESGESVIKRWAADSV